VDERFELLFDGDCGLCRACVRWLERRDVHGRLRCAPSFTCTWPDAASLPFADTVIVRDAEGATYFRSTAVARALAAVPGFWGLVGRWFVVVNRFAPARRLNDLLYEIVGRNRRTISNGLVRVGLLDASCRLPDSSTP